MFCVACRSVEQRANYSQPTTSASNNSTSNDWTSVAVVPANMTDDDAELTYYVQQVNVTGELSDRQGQLQLEYRVVCNWLDYGKERRGRPSPPSAGVSAVTHCVGMCRHSGFVASRPYTSRRTSSALSTLSLDTLNDF